MIFPNFYNPSSDYLSKILKNEEDIFNNINFYQVQECVENEGNLDPNISVIQKDDGYLLQIEIPGVKKEDLTVNVENNNTLVITGKRPQPRKSMKQEHKHWDNFTKKITLTDNIDINKITSIYKDGLLEINFLYLKDKKTVKEIKIN